VPAIVAMGFRHKAGGRRQIAEPVRLPSQSPSRARPVAQPISSER
jgi:hypothetical protein